MFAQPKAYLEIRRNPKKSRSEIQALQDKKLRALITYCHEFVPYYRQLFDQIGIVPGDIRGRDDIEKLPILDKETVRREQDNLLSRQVRREDLVSQTTGGSTGTPLTVYKSQLSNALDAAGKLRTFFEHGFKLTDKIAVAQYRPPRLKWFHRLGLHREYNVPHDVSIAEQVDFIETIGATVIDAAPNRIELISRLLLKSRRRLDQIRLVFTHSEKLTEGQRQLVIEAFGLNPVDCYGCTESAVMAAECKFHRGYHIEEDLVLLETIPQPGCPIDHALCRVVVTNLNNYAMPLIRFEVGDFAIRSSESCKCDSNFPLLQEISGRSSDLMTLPSGEKVSGYLLAKAIEEYTDVIKYRARQRRSGAIDVDLILEPKVESPEVKLRQQLLAEFPGIELSFNYPDSIPDTARGKLCRFESEYEG